MNNSSSKISTCLFVIVLIVYSIVTFILITKNSYNLAYLRAFGLDEAHMTNMTFQLAKANSFNPQGFFNYGGGYYYPVVGLLILVQNFVSITPQIAVIMLRSVSLLSVIGIACLLFAFGRSIGLSPIQRILSALSFLLMKAVIGLTLGAHPDMLQAFYILAGLYVLSTVNSIFEIRKIAVVAFLAGLAAGVKYAGLFLFLVLGAYCVCLAVVSGKVDGLERKFVRKLLFIVIVAFSVGFLLCNPYVLLDSKEFFLDILYENYHINFGDYLGSSWNPKIWISLLTNEYTGEMLILSGSTALLYLLTRKGVVSAVKRYKFANSDAERVIIALGMFLVLYGGYLLLRVNFHTARYLLPIIPLIILIIFKLLFAASNYVERNIGAKLYITIIVVGIVLISFLQITLNSYLLFTDYLLRPHSTRIELSRFMENMYEPGTRVWSTEYVYLTENFSRVGTDYFLLPEKMYKDEPEIIIISGFFIDMHLHEKGEGSMDPAKAEISYNMASDIINNSVCGYKKTLELDDSVRAYYIFERDVGQDLQNCLKT